MIGPHWRWWARRAILLLSGVYLIGMMGWPTLVPFLAALLAIGGDAIRTARTGRRSSSEYRT